MKNIIAAAASLLVISSSYSQDPHFTQFYANPLYTNPAMAGNAFKDQTPAGRLNLNYRNQWPGLPGSFQTVNLGWDQQFDKLHGGLGAQFQSDVQGSGFLTTSGFLGTYAYRGQINPGLQLSIGVQAGMYSRSIDFSKLQFGDQISPSKGFDTSYANGPDQISAISYPNFNMGFTLSHENAYFGIALFNIIEPNTSFYQNPDVVLPRRIAIHGGYSFRISENFSLIPQAQFMNQSLFNELLIGLNANHSEFIYGLWYRQVFGNYNNADAIAATIGYNFKGIRLIYSYDLTISQARSAIPFSHEISLRYCWKTKQSKSLQSNAIN